MNCHQDSYKCTLLALLTGRYGYRIAAGDLSEAKISRPDADSPLITMSIDRIIKTKKRGMCGY